jgi:hypothetical protein
MMGWVFMGGEGKQERPGELLEKCSVAGWLADGE